jgi:hypothetical protein
MLVVLLEMGSMLVVLLVMGNTLGFCLSSQGKQERASASKLLVPLM